MSSIGRMSVGYDPHAVSRLFQAVVTQALIDATGDPRYVRKPLENVRRKNDETLEDYAERKAEILNARKANWERETTIVRDEARDWLLYEQSGAFAQIVSLAGYNPDDIRERAIKLAAKGWPKPPFAYELKLAA
jgi:hypothetical protein